MAFNNNNTSTTGHGAGNVPAGGDHKPTMGEKLGGTLDKITGKITNNPAKVAEGEAKKRGDTVGAQQADAAADAHKNTGTTGSHTGTTGTHGTHGAGVAGTGIGAGHHDNSHSHTGTGGLTGNNHGTSGTGLTGSNHGPSGAGLTGNNHGTTGSGLTGDHHGHSHTGTGAGLTGNHGHTGATSGSGITGGTGLGHKAPGEPTMGDKITGNAQSAAGRATNDPVQYAQGEARKTDTSYGNTGAGTGYGSGVGAGTGAGFGSGVGAGHHGVGDNTYGTTGTGHGLTGSHGDHSHGATGAGIGSHGTHGAGYDNNNAGKPSMGEKITGGMDKMVGKATNDPARVAQGQAKTEGNNAYHHASGTGGGLSGNTTGYGTGTGATHTGAPGTNAGAGTY